MKWSLQLQIKAANNESLEEPDDLDKEIELLKRNRKQESVEVQKDNSILYELITINIDLLTDKVFEKVNKFNDLFMSNEIHLGINKGLSFHGAFLIINKQSAIKLLLSRLVEGDSINDFYFHFIYKGYKNNGINSFDLSKHIYFYFSHYKYSIQISSIKGQKNLEFLYHQSLTEEQQNQIADEIAKSILEEIKENVV